MFFNSKFETANLRQVFRAVPKAGTPAKFSPRKESPSKIGEENTAEEPPKKLYSEYNLYL